MHTREEKLEAFGRLLDIMDDLREKCPWDRKQTFESLRHLTIEERIENSPHYGIEALFIEAEGEGYDVWVTPGWEREVKLLD